MNGYSVNWAALGAYAAVLLLTLVLTTWKGALLVFLFGLGGLLFAKVAPNLWGHSVEADEADAFSRSDRI